MHQSHFPLMPHIFLSELGQHWFRKWLVACSAPNHYLNQCCLIVNWTLRNKFQWNFNKNSEVFIHENSLENVICKMVNILSRGRWVINNSDLILINNQNDVLRFEAHLSVVCLKLSNLSVFFMRLDIWNRKKKKHIQQISLDTVKIPV